MYSNGFRRLSRNNPVFRIGFKSIVVSIIRFCSRLPFSNQYLALLEKFKVFSVLPVEKKNHGTLSWENRG